MSRKIEENEVKERLFDIYGNNIILVKYCGSIGKKSLFHCNICNYDWWASAQPLTSGNSGCPSCRNVKLSSERRFSSDYIFQFLESKNIYCYNVDDYKNLYTKLFLVCKVCENEWISCFANLRESGCPKCGQIIRADKKRTPFSKIISVYADKNIEILNLDDYKNANTLLDAYCKTCGHRWFTTYGSLQGMKYVCPNCARNASFCTEEHFKEQVYNTHKDRIYVVNYCGQSTKYSTFGCSFCGYEWEADGHAVIQGNGCPKCNLSKGEIKISEWLDYNNIEYQREVKFDECLSVKNYYLRFDFYLPDYNILCEFQGQQHYSEIPGFKGSRSLKEQQTNDQIKRDFCTEYGIELLEIPYWEFDNIESILENRLLYNQ